MKLLFGLVLLAELSCPLFGQLKVQVSGKTEISLTQADLAAMSRHRTKVEDHGVAIEYEGVLMHDILERAGAPLGKELKGKAMSTYVLATARDGYAVIYALTEFDTAFGDGDILIADLAGGKPLEGEKGPLRVVVPHDKKPARSLRMLERIDVVQLRQ